MVGSKLGGGGLGNTAVTPGSYTNTNLTVDQQGRITAASNGSAGSTYTAMTAGALPVTNSGANGQPFVATWNDTHVNALGGVADGAIKVATLPAKGKIIDAAVVLTGAESALDSMTVSLGRAGANYIDYIVASDAKAAANTIYGNASGERGTNLTGYDRPSWTATTDIYVRFVGTGDTLDAAFDTSGTITITYEVTP